MKIVVIGGGISPEREVSLKSSRAVFEAAMKAGYDADYYDWQGETAWFEGKSSLYDLAIPILHGVGGEDGQIQQLLENANLPFVGTDSKVSAICMDKELTRYVLSENDILTPQGQVVSQKEYEKSSFVARPHVLKPALGGSSIDTFILKDSPFLADSSQLTIAFERNSKMLVEEYICGVEITVPVLEGYTLPIIEIVPPKGKVFDYENKYNGSTEEFCPPQNVSEDDQKVSQELGLKVHTLLGARHFSRVDMIISQNGIYVLELNTIPGMTNQSLFPKAAEAAGLSMISLVDHLIKLAIR